MQSPHLRELLAAIFAPGSSTWTSYRQAPAAKHYHQAYRHGLLEHSVTVAQAVSAVSAVFPGIDRDVAVTGALLHDIGKLDTYELSDDGIEMSDRGRLHGEIALGYFRVRDEIERIDGFPRRSPRRCCTSSSATTARSSTGLRWSPALARRRSSTWPTTSGRSSAASTGSSVRSTTARSGLGYDKGIGGVAYFGSDTEPIRAEAA